MAQWLMKSESETWSWMDQQTKGTTSWDGVRNYQAANHMKAMEVGDLCFFYHSGKERAVVGIVRVTRTYYPDPTDPKGIFGMVDVETYKTLPTPVSLTVIKEKPSLHHLALVRQSRLSVMPVDDQSWATLLELGGL